MNNPSESPEINELESARQMQSWVRRYAENRSLPMMLGLVVFTTLFLAISLPSYWGGQAYRDGNIPLLVVCIAVGVAGLAGTIYISIPKWGSRRLPQLGEWIYGRIYGREGRVTISTPAVKRPVLTAIFGAVFTVCVTGNVLLGKLGYLPNDKYSQPISAIYCVPFVVAKFFLMRPGTGYIPLLWPLLYGLHALLIVAGAPILFVGSWEPLNLWVPVIGYGLLTGLVGHFYSRWALHRARLLAAGNRQQSGEHT
jgi:hypothetical protein